MCGITGITYSDSELVQQMNMALEHRGPDYSGIYSDANVTLGHTLLSIRGDTVKSRQPVHHKNSDWVLVFNGQLYNTAELRRELNVSFSKEEIDTLLLYHIIQKKGWDFINSIQGMYAIGLYNIRESKLKLYRDHSGQKHIYYCFQNGKLAFASELSALLSWEDISREADEVGVTIACKLGYIPGSRTIVRGVKKILPGQFLSIDIKDRRMSVGTNSLEDTDCFINEELDCGVSRFTGLHFQSRRSLALNLSGGLDSSIILHEAREHGQKITTYTSYYEEGLEEDNSEALLARKLARVYGSDHREISINSNIYEENFLEAYGMLDEPNYNVSIPIYHHMAKKQGVNGDGFRVLFSGDGGDEVFYGYADYDKSNTYDLMLRFLPASMIALAYYLKKGDWIRVDCPWERWSHFRSWGGTFLNRNIAFNDVAVYLREELGECLENQMVNGAGCYQHLLADRLTWLAAENFVRLDKLYMSQSVEARAPFGYTPMRRVVDSKTHTADYLTSRKHKKWLRQHYRGKLPNYVVDRQDKVGWRGPMEKWYGEGLRDLFLDLVNRERGPCINWPMIKKHVASTKGWPGKQTHLYLSIASICNKLGISA